MIVDCHVHTCAFLPGHGTASPTLRRSLPFLLLRAHLGLYGADGDTESALEKDLVHAVVGTPELDAAVVLAFDAVHTSSGEIDRGRTHYVVSNDYVAELVGRHPRLLFGASVHPFRRDAVAEIERCVERGAVLLKWLPITQGFDPSDERCIPVYEALAHFGLPLLSHTGWEHTLPRIDRSVASPTLLVPALRRGVTVIAAHCGTARTPDGVDHLDDWMRMAQEHERFYGDTAALSMPGRWGAFARILGNATTRAKLIHGSDWPLPPMPNPLQLGWRGTAAALGVRNALRRDVLIKQHLGFDDAYWHRGATLLRMRRPNWNAVPELPT
ncbi:MAG: amidohydrolase family protein [Gemmatimonadaceae bacterium]